MSDFLTTEEVAARYRVGPETIRRWHREGSGPPGFPKGVKSGHRVLFPRAEVHDDEASGDEASALLKEILADVRALRVYVESLPPEARAAIAGQVAEAGGV